MPAFTYESKNREVYFVIDYFKQNPAAAVRVSWKEGIGRDATISVGDVLATLAWSDGTVQDLKAPGGCNGVIEATNRQFKYERLTRPPAQWAVRLRASP